MNSILREDCAYVANGVDLSPLRDAVVIVTGAAGFLGYQFIQQILYASSLGTGPRQVLALDNFQLGRSAWTEKISDPSCRFVSFDIAKDDIHQVIDPNEVDYVIHLASIASPTFYRRYPLETIDANVWGLRNLLEAFKQARLKGLLFFSSSEIYGDPDPQWIPTPEEYRGNVASTGPRSCYDEAKRFGETLSYYYHQIYRVPIRVVRPFNNYGPGMSMEDKRVVADFAKAVLHNQPIIIHSNGAPTRTFCYAADAMMGYWKALLHDQFDIFNIGSDHPEISISQLATIYKSCGQKMFGYDKDVVHQASAEAEYLKDNPQRRCPDISKARAVLGFDPRIDVREGIGRYLRFLCEDRT